MLRPSRPMMRPFMSSEGSGTTDTVDSDTTSAAKPLHRGGQDPPAPPIGLLACLHLEVSHQHHGLAAGLVLDLPKQLFLGGSGIEAGDTLQMAACFFSQGLRLAAGIAQRPLLVDQHLLTMSQVRRALLERCLPLGKTLLQSLRLYHPMSESGFLPLPVTLRQCSRFLLGT